MRLIFIRVCVLFLSLVFAIVSNAADYLIKMSPNKSGIGLGFYSFFAEKSVGQKRLVKEYSFASWKHVKLDDANLKQFKNRFGEAVEYIEPNYIYHAFDTEPNIDAIPSGQWGLAPVSKNGVEAEKAWKITKGSKEVLVAVIDTGVDYRHSALRNNIESNGWNVVANNNDPFDDNGHGTHCAGIIAADSTKAMGVAPKIKILPVKFLDRDGAGTLADAVSAIQYAVDHKAKILSNSWGGGDFSKALEDVIKYARDKGVLFVAAAGNDYSNNDNKPAYPASYTVENIIVVAASTAEGDKAYFSNYGAATVHLFAPGHKILSTTPNEGLEAMSGTSMACPFVAGVAGLVLSKYPNYDYMNIKNAILDNVVKKDSFSDLVSTGGLLNAHQALR